MTRAVTTRTFLVYVLSLCSPPALSDIERIQLLQAQGASSTLSFMNTYWVTADRSDEEFWEVQLAYPSSFLV